MQKKRAERETDGQIHTLLNSSFMKSFIILTAMIITVALSSVETHAAYHHEGERDTSNFLSVYPDKAGSKLDHCALCHTGGSYTNSTGKNVTLGSCQWCHYTTDYGRSNGNIGNTINSYGKSYKDSGRNSSAISRIDDYDSDGDGSTNRDEIAANSFPGNEKDTPFLKMAPYKIYTRAQLEAMAQHTQFLLMNTSRSGDYYAEYSGVPMKDLLDDAGITGNATGITVFAPDGWSQYHPLYYDATAEMYHVYGNMPGESYQYPPGTYSYVLQADATMTPGTGWCDYSAPSCAGRANGDPIFVQDGLKAILAMKRDGADLDTGILTDENKLDGEGPYRIVVPQKASSPPDQSSKSDNQNVEWPYNYDWDHNAGAATRSVTIIRVEPLPEGTTDIDVMEAGWNYIDNGQIIVYGAIKDDSSSSKCLTLGDDAGFTLPNINIMGYRFSIHFKWMGGVLFQPDFTTYSMSVDSSYDEISLAADNSITIPCITVAGKNYEVKFTTSNYIDWTLSSITEK